ncbi:MAG TPA: CoA pyrophosphatase [Thermoanaerobaculia bacterium]|nr:CoA pyrophosphatase [Thermoanaerobaculia bacterium]
MAEVRDRLSRRARDSARPAAGNRRAAVLVPLFVREGGLWTVFTLRTDSVEHHRGQISFPGGAEEPDDRTLFHTALRESEEELGIRPEDALPLGRLSPIVTVTNFYVEPFVAALPQPYEFKPAAAEIAEVLEVPIAGLLDPSVLEMRSFPGREDPVLFYHYGEHVIWGATARILAELLAALGAASRIA